MSWRELVVNGNYLDSSCWHTHAPGICLGRMAAARPHLVVSVIASMVKLVRIFCCSATQANRDNRGSGNGFDRQFVLGMLHDRRTRGSCLLALAALQGRFLDSHADSSFLVNA